MIPGKETGIRRFCLWAIGLAVLTLRKIVATPGYTSGIEVKVSHMSVTMTRLLTSVAVGNDWMLKRLFEQAARGLPLAPPSAVRRPSHALLRRLEPASDCGAGGRQLPLDGAGRRTEGGSAH